MKKDHEDASPRSEFRVAVVGHRKLRGIIITQFVTAQCLTILRQAQAEHGSVIAISALAEGADSLFANAALSLDIPLEIVRPFEEFSDDFPSGPSRKFYESLRRAARHETRLPFKGRSDEAYQVAMYWIIDHSDLLVAVWDGRSAAGAGGTGDAVRYAQEKRRKFIHINVTELTVTYYSSEQKEFAPP